MEYNNAIKAQIEWKALPKSAGEISFAGTQQENAQACISTAHAFYMDGAPAALWQPWMALAAWGYIESSSMAVPLAVIARVFDDMKQYFHITHIGETYTAFRSLAWLLGLSPYSGPPQSPDGVLRLLEEEKLHRYTLNECYGLLTEAVQKHDWRLCRNTLELMAAYMEPEKNYKPDIALRPGYELIPSALAVIAGQNGFPLKSLNQDARMWYWPAMCSGDGILPVYWPF